MKPFLPIDARRIQLSLQWQSQHASPVLNNKLLVYSCCQSSLNKPLLLIGAVAPEHILLRLRGFKMLMQFPLADIEIDEIQCKMFLILFLYFFFLTTILLSSCIGSSCIKERNKLRYAMYAIYGSSPEKQYCNVLQRNKIKIS